VDWTILALLSNYLAQHFVLPPTHVTRCLALLSAMEPSNVLAWDDPIKDFNKARKSLGLLSPCACLWGDDCKKAHQSPGYFDHVLELIVIIFKNYFENNQNILTSSSSMGFLPIKLMIIIISSFLIFSFIYFSTFV
jgi:hypothetical protein